METEVQTVEPYPELKFKSDWTKKQKAARNAKKRVAKKSRKKNRK